MLNQILISPSLIYFETIFLLILLGVLIFFLWSLTVAVRYRSSALKQLALVLNSELEPLDKISGPFNSSYKIKFIYNNREYEYLDKEITVGSPPYCYSEGFLKTKTQSNFTLQFFGNLGNSIGKVVVNITSSLYIKGCKEISDKSTLPVPFNSFRIFTNNEAKAKSLLLEHDVAAVLLEYTDVTSPCLLFPVSLVIEEGIITLKFSNDFKPYFSELYKTPESIKRHLSKMMILVDRIM